MIISQEKLIEAKQKYDGQAIQEICDYFGIEFNTKSKSALCPFHADKNPSFSWNPKTASFRCFGCAKSFDIIDLYLAQGMTFIQAVQKLFDNVGIEHSFSARGVQSKPSYKYPKREFGNDRAQVEEYLLRRKISKKTLDYADIQADEKGNIVFHYYDANDVLLNVKYRPSRVTKPGENKMWFQKDSDTTPILFNMNRIDPTKPLVITEGCIDALSIIESGHTNVVSVPNGAQSLGWIEENWDWLEQFNKIIIWSDNDEPGLKMRNECTRRLGTWRTSYIEIKEEDIGKNRKKCKDANEVLFFYGKDRVMEYINNPTDTPIEGVLDLSEAEDFDIESAEGLYSGITELDSQIYKFVFGTVVLLTGKAGCVDCDTEFFNGYKWKKISDYKEGDKVLQYNLNGTAELITPLQYHKYPEDNLWEVKTKYGINMCVSEEHNCWYETSKGNLYHKTFKEIMDNHKNSKNGFQGKFYTTFNYGQKGVDLTDDEIKLMLAVICDGSFIKGHKNNYCRINLKKNRKKEVLRELLKKCNIEFKEKIYKKDYSAFTFYAPRREKVFSKYWYQCSHKQLEIICENILFWDGSIRYKSFSTSVKENADFIQFAFTCCGFRCSMFIYNRIGEKHSSTNGKQYEYKSIEYNLKITDRTKVSMMNSKNKETIQPYKTRDGFKYCFTTNSGMWVQRRDNKIMITGNSGKSTLAIQMAISEPLNQGYNCFVYSGELPAPILRNWVETGLVGRENITMKNTTTRVLEKTARQQARDWYKGRVMLYDDSLGVTKESLFQKMEEAVRKLGCRVITIDNLMCIDLQCSENGRLEAEKEFVKDLVLFAKKFNVLIFLLAHPRKTKLSDGPLDLESIAGSSSIGNLCHMALSIHRYTNKEKEGETNSRGDYIKGYEPKTYDAYIEVIKNRLTGLMPKVEVYFDYPSYRFYRTPEELWKKYRWNKDLKPKYDYDPNKHTIEKENPLYG